MYINAWGFSEGAQNDIFSDSNTGSGTPAPTTGTWTSLGCYTDGSDRTLSFQTNIDTGTTPAACQSRCQAAGYKYSGVEFGSQCFCGDSLAAAAQKVGDSDCSMPCSGDAGQTCGNAYRLNLYEFKADTPASSTSTTATTLVTSVKSSSTSTTKQAVTTTARTTSAITSQVSTQKPTSTSKSSSTTKQAVTTTAKTTSPITSQVSTHKPTSTSKSTTTTAQPSKPTTSTGVSRVRSL